MGLFDQLQAQVIGQLTSGNPKLGEIINSLLQQNGGVQGLVSKFQNGQTAEIFKSWLSQGPNMPISASQLTDVLGQNQISDISKMVGLNSNDVIGQLTEHLPELINKLSPDGQLNLGGNTALSGVLNMAKGFFGKN